MTDFYREGCEEDIKTIFGDNSDNVIRTQIPFCNNADMSDLAVLCGVFKSKNQARKNGWIGPIPCGYSEYGSRRNRIYIWNPALDQHVWCHPCWDLYDTTGVLNWSVR